MILVLKIFEKQNVLRLTLHLYRVRHSNFQVLTGLGFVYWKFGNKTEFASYGTYIVYFPMQYITTCQIYNGIKHVKIIEHKNRY